MEKLTRTLPRYLALTVLSSLIVLVISVYTNENTFKIIDSACYIDMARNGIVGNNALVAPFAYRFITTELARQMMELFGMNIHQAFTTIFWLGAVSQLIMVYVFAKNIGADDKNAFFIMLVIAFSFQHVKQLQFNVYRTDHLAYSFLLLELLLYMKKKYLGVLFIGIPGLFLKEYLVVPVLLVSLDMLTEKKYPWVKRIVKSAVPILLLSVVYVVSRVEIPVSSSIQFIDPIKKGDSLTALLRPFQNPKFALNVFLSIIAYFLPAIAIGAFYGLRGIRESFERHRWLLAYFLMILMLTFYGGNDHGRLVTYFVPVLVVFLAAQFNDAKTWEKILLLLLLVWYNKIFMYIPQTPDMLTAFRRRHWLGFFKDEVTILDLYRVLQMAGVVSCFWLAAHVGHLRLRRTTS